MKLRLLRSISLKTLIDDVPDNLDLYRNGTFDYLNLDSTNYFEIDYEADEIKLSSIDCSEDNHYEVGNCISIFEAMDQLSHYLARDERLWVYLTHTALLNYTRKRWPIPEDDEKAVKHIRNHFFVIGARGFERDNAASRLWWMASLCDRATGLSLKKSLTCLLHQYDVRANIIERPTTSQSIYLFSAILKKLNESFDGDKKLFEREIFCKFMKNLNLKGGIKLLAALSENEIDMAIDDCL